MGSQDYGAHVAEMTSEAGGAPAGGSALALQNGNGINPEHLPLAEAQQLATAYESFDRLMQDTTVHSAELLRHVLALPTVAAREVAQVRSAAERRVRAEQEWQQSVLTALQEELNAGRQRAEQLAEGVAHLVRDFTALSDRAAEALAEIASRGPAIGQAVPAPADQNAVPAVVGDQDEATAGASGEPDGPAGDGFGNQPGAVVGSNAAPAGEGDGDAETAGGAVSLVVHGARPTTALSLRRYLAGLSHVSNVKVREYAGDALHAQLAVERPMTAEDFQAWGIGSGLQIINLTDDEVELRLADPPVFG